MPTTCAARACASVNWQQGGTERVGVRGGDPPSQHANGIAELPARVPVTCTSELKNQETVP